MIARWTTVDPSALSYKSTSPYAYVKNNPISSIDPDGRDLIVLNAQHKLAGLGHAAVLIGNPQKGYNFYVKNGTTEHFGAYGKSDIKVVGRHYDTLNDFLKSDDNKEDGKAEYNRGLEIRTDDATDEKMEKAATDAVNSDYNVLDQSCIDVASDALSAGGFSPGYSTRNFPNTTYQPISQTYTTLASGPNERFGRMLEQNQQGNLINLPIPGSKKKAVIIVGPLSPPTVIPDLKPEPNP